MPGRNAVDAGWGPLHEPAVTCRVDPFRDGYRLSHSGKTLSLRLPQAESATTRAYSGSIAPILGWVSRRFDDKRPAPAIVWRGRLAGEVVLRSEIIC